MEQLLTPSQEARRYADENGFMIVAVGRRYEIIDKKSIVGNRVIAEVGGYPAALNAMRKVVDAHKDVPLVTVTIQTATGARLDELAKILPVDRDTMRAKVGSDEWHKQHPWRVGIIAADGVLQWFTAHANRSEALKQLRRKFAGRIDAAIQFFRGA